MRYTEIINELNMSPSHLAQFGKTQGGSILAGFEAEVILLEVLEKTTAPDYSVDQNIGWRDDFDDIANFFEFNRNSRRIHLDPIEEEFREWQNAEVNNYVEDHLENILDKMAHEANQDRDEDDQLDPTDFDYEARELLTQQAENKLDLSLQRWLNANNMHKYSDISDVYDLTWPVTQEIEPEKYDIAVANDIADVLSKTLGKRVIANTSYHGYRQKNTYHIEPDQSLAPDNNSSEDMGIEIISYPMPLPEMMDDLAKTMKFIDVHAYTNNSTGLHINMSIPDKEHIDYVKLVLFAGDDHVLQQFDREFNEYAESAFSMVANATNRNGTEAFDLLQSGMIDAASKALKERNKDKYTSINMHDTYVEFRSMGGDYITKWPEIQNNIMRFAQALTVACDPEAERKAYALKMYKLLATSDYRTPDNDDVIRIFSMYNSGAWSKSQLRQYLKNRADKRKEDNRPF
jgi:hypothetical protein